MVKAGKLPPIEQRMIADPIVIKAISARGNMALGELAECLEIFGKRSISMASGILKGTKRG